MAIWREIGKTHLCFSRLALCRAARKGRSWRERPSSLSFAISLWNNKEMATMLLPSARSWARPGEKLQGRSLFLFLLKLLKGIWGKLLERSFPQRPLFHYDSLNCSLYNFAYVPSNAIRSSWLPCSVILPFAITAISSALRIVDSRCATTSVVRPRHSSSSAP